MFIYNRFATKKLNYTIIKQDNINNNNNNIEKNYKWFKPPFNKNWFVTFINRICRLNIKFQLASLGFYGINSDNRVTKSSCLDLEHMP